jgi:hypothetical protein
MPKKPLTYRELIKKLHPLGFVVLEKRGKGSEVILLKPTKPGLFQGLQYPLKNHGPSTVITIPVLLAIKRRFNLSDSDIWG